MDRDKPLIMKAQVKQEFMDFTVVFVGLFTLGMIIKLIAWIVELFNH